MSTFGTAEDFLYFLPRIAELFARGEALGAVCLDILARKIEEAGTGRLNDVEWDAVRAWLLGLWDTATTDENVWIDQPRRVLAACSRLGVEEGQLIERWLSSTTPVAKDRLAQALIDAAYHANQGRTLPLDEALVRAHHSRPIALPADLDPETLEELSTLLAFPPFC